MNMSASEVRAKRATLISDAGKILSAAKAEGRENLTASEERSWKRLHERAEGLKARAGQLDAEDANVIVGTRRALDPEQSFRSQMWRSEDREIEDMGGVGGVARDLILGGGRRAMSVGADTAGGFLVGGGIMGEILDLLRPRNAVLQAGARMIEISPEDERRPVLVSEPDAEFHAENEALSEGEITLGEYTFEPRTLVTPVVKASMELVEDAPSLTNLIQRSFAAAIAKGMDTQAMIGQGDGDTTGPRGLSTWPGVGSTNMASAYLGFEDMSDGKEAILLQDGPEPTALIHSVKQNTHFAKLVDGEGLPYPVPSDVENIRRFPTTKLTDLAFLGRFSHLHILFRNQLHVEILRERYMDKLQWGFVGWFRFDVVVERAEVFHQYTSVSTA